MTIISDDNECDATRRAVAAHRAALAGGDAGYFDPLSGLFVLTAVTHLARGTFCDQGCRHCPYV